MHTEIKIPIKDYAGERLMFAFIFFFKSLKWYFLNSSSHKTQMQIAFKIHYLIWLYTWQLMQGEKACLGKLSICQSSVE